MGWAKGTSTVYMYEPGTNLKANRLKGWASERGVDVRNQPKFHNLSGAREQYFPVNFEPFRFKKGHSNTCITFAVI